MTADIQVSPQKIREDLCPTPHKKRHLSKAEAVEHCETRRRTMHRQARDGMVVYQCACEGFHVGHSQAVLRERVRNALRGADRRTGRRR